MRARRAGRAATGGAATSGVAVTALALLVGCGVPAEEAPRAIPTESVRPLPGPRPVADQPPPPASAPSGEGEQVLCLTRDERLVEVRRPAPEPGTVVAAVRELLAGPTVEESAADLETALGGTPLVTGVRLEDGLAVVTLRSGSADSARSDDVLALGQVVCTLTARADVRGVVFERDGRRIAVPRGDGSLTEAPLRGGDFRELVASPGPPP